MMGQLRYYTRDLAFYLLLVAMMGMPAVRAYSLDLELADNPTSDLLSGKVRWHVYVSPPQAGRELVFILEYDPAYLNTLFASAA